MRAFIFPGQGSQAVGMGQALAGASATAREVFREVDDALGQRLSQLMCDGPADQLTLTENAQPAIMANAIATLRVLECEGGLRLVEKADFVAGHSLGEYTALCAAGALDLSTTAKLLKLRGQAMQAAVPVGEGTMAVILKLEFDQVAEIAAAAAQGEVCAVANDNAPGQVVISGDKAAVDRALEQLKGAGARAMLLPVSAPFHCRLMAPAAEVMAKALGRAGLQSPLLPVFANVTAAAVTDPDQIIRLLVEQVTGTVRWRGSVLAMQEAGVHHFAEFGGKVLGPMIKHISPDVETVSVTSMDEIETLAKALQRENARLVRNESSVESISGGSG